MWSHRPDDAEFVREHDVLTSGLQLDRLDRIVAASFDAALSGDA
jgi:hypothetical protein